MIRFLKPDKARAMIGISPKTLANLVIETLNRFQEFGWSLYSPFAHSMN
jgi:hypothetical protein